ncbi:hypothetical protein Q4I30_001689 [Leishmania utingensis]|uniref:Uncharacterized protein n=1 Tax=Leishmania utingensis TaxID=653362 RepID=A0AAW3AV64_9TRYP
MTLGVGAGTFTVLVTVSVAILLALVGYYLAPESALLIILGHVALPFIVYSGILTAPHGSAANTTTALDSTPYRERQLPSNTYPVDKLVSVRIVVLVVLALSVLAGISLHILTLAKSPPYEAPRVRCLRQQLKEAHPSWYR